MRLSVRFLPILIVWPGLAASQQVDTSTTKSTILAAERALQAETRSRGVEAFIDRLAPDAVVLLPMHPILGSADAGLAMRRRYGSPASYSFDPKHVVASTDGTFGCAVGTTEFLDAMRVLMKGHYITCWRRDGDGAWRIAGHQRSDAQALGHLLDGEQSLGALPHSATHAAGGQMRDQILDTESRFALMGANGAAGPVPAFVDYAATDALLMPQFALAHGRGEIAASFEGWPASRVLEWQPDRRFGFGTGGLGFSVGNSSVFDRGSPATVMRRGHFLTVWRQEPDGRWLYVFDLGSPQSLEAQ